MDKLIIKKAKTHNLKNISLEIPKNKLVVFTGVSGSGKSSLVFDTIYSEGQRRYVESLSSYARQFLGIMDKPDVQSIEGISPAIAIDQRSVSKNPRSTVGTITEIYDYLRLLFAHVGVPHCPNCNIKISSYSTAEIIKAIKQMRGDITILAPLITAKRGEHRAILEEAVENGFLRVRLNGRLMLLEEAIETPPDPQRKHDIDVYIDKITIDKNLDRIRLSDSVETALKLGQGVLIIFKSKNKDNLAEDIIFSEKLACPKCAFSMRKIEPRTFSFNSPYGACKECSGLGTKMEVNADLVIPNKNLALAEGAIQPWTKTLHNAPRQGWYWSILYRMSLKYGIDMGEPVKNLSKEKLDIILQGDGEMEGVIGNLKRRHKETESDWMRAEIEKYMNIHDCPACGRKRLKPEALAVKVAGLNVHEIVIKSIEEAHKFFVELQKSQIFTKTEKEISGHIIREIKNRLEFLQKVGLNYLTLERTAGTLSGGEAQRIRLATQLGSRLSGVFYILDEPSIGLHTRDQKRLIDTMKELRDLGNSVFVVEHDPLTIKSADYIVDIGPAAGKHGGRIIFQGTPSALRKSDTLTAEYLYGRSKVDGKLCLYGTPLQRRQNQNYVSTGHFSKKDNSKTKNDKRRHLIIKGAAHNNLKNITVKIPLGKLIAVTGVSGSGKSSLVNDTLAKALMREYHGAQTIPGKYRKIEGLNNLNKAILVDQSPIGRTPRSNPVTYTGIFTHIRDLFAQTQEAKSRGYKSGRFSFNMKGGRCERCRGGGANKVEMFFMPDIYVECEVCHGARYNSEVIEIEYKGKNISDVLQMTTEEAFEFFKAIPPIADKLAVLNQVGLGYMELGQPAPSLSGGEAQRVKLAAELSRKSTGRTLYILDEPTTGLHADDINKLLSVLKDLVVSGNSVLIIEHNLDIVRNADWIIDLGPEGGSGGGEVVAEGTPAQVAKVVKSYTGRYLKKNF